MIAFYRIAPQTIAAEQNVNSNEVNPQYTIDPKQSDSIEAQVQTKSSSKLKTLPIQPRSYLMLGPSILEVPFNTLAPATATKENLVTRMNILLTGASSKMVNAMSVRFLEHQDSQRTGLNTRMKQPILSTCLPC